jgi:hypothetical protein
MEVKSEIQNRPISSSTTHSITTKMPRPQRVATQKKINYAADPDSDEEEGMQIEGNESGDQEFLSSEGDSVEPEEDEEDDQEDAEGKPIPLSVLLVEI